MFFSFLLIAGILISRFHVRMWFQVIIFEKKKYTRNFLTYLQPYFDTDIWKNNGHTSGLANEVQISSEKQFSNKNVTGKLKEQSSELDGRTEGKKGTRYCR